jgi:hypothetical protein
MSRDEPQEAGAQNSRRVGHELSDVGAKYISASALILAFAIAGNYLIVLETFKHFYAGPSTPQQTLEGAAPLFPEPRLQVNPRRDLDQLKAQENEVLTTYGWVDRDSGVVRIPIEHAMDLVSERGLPDFKPATKGGGTK